ncbi:hypothetical protein G6M03_26650 [Agrobacterium tumefaciens]|nr:hypothetical protein [Agrobacterium tumefaciens]
MKLPPGLLTLGTIVRQPFQRGPDLGHGVRDVVRDALTEMQSLEDLSEVHTDTIDLGNRSVIGRGTRRRECDPEDGSTRKLRNGQPGARGLGLDVNALSRCQPHA